MPKTKGAKRHQRKLNRQGAKAEQKVGMILQHLSNEYHVFNNVLIMSDDKTIQMDHVVVSPYGIFVIETKSYYGLIFGDMVDTIWIRLMPDGYKDKFPSPYLQNEKHIQGLMNVLHMDVALFQNFIVFTNDIVNISGVSYDNAILSDNLCKCICAFQDKLLTDAQVLEICDKLKELNIKSRKNNAKHVRHILEASDKK